MHWGYWIYRFFFFFFTLTYREYTWEEFDVVYYISACEWLSEGAACVKIMQCMCANLRWQNPVRYKCTFTSDAFRANVCSSTVCAWVVKLWCSSRLAALVRDRWRWEGGAALNAWRRHCRARVPLPLARQNRTASFWTCQRGTVVYIHIYTQKKNSVSSEKWMT